MGTALPLLPPMVVLVVSLEVEAVIVHVVVMILEELVILRVMSLKSVLIVAIVIIS